MRVAAEDLAALPSAVGKQPSRFVLFVAARVQPETAEQELVDVATLLLRGDAVAIYCWGPGADRLETCFDIASIQLFSDNEPVIMTSSNEDMPLEDAIWEGVMATYPDEAYADGFERVVVAVVGSPEWVARADSYLAAGVPLSNEA